MLGNSQSVQQAEINLDNHNSNSSGANPPPLTQETFYLVSVKNF